MKTTSQGGRRASLSPRLPNFSIVPIDIAYQVVAHILHSHGQARRDFLEFGREGRLRWWKFPPPSEQWVKEPEPVASDFLKLCEIVAATKTDDQEYLHLAVRGEINEDVDSTIEVNGEPLRLLLNVHFGLSRNDLVAMYPSLGRRREEAKQQEHAMAAVAAVNAPTLPSAQKPADVSQRVWAVAKLLERLERERGSPDVGIPVSILLDDVRANMAKGMTVSETTLREARRFRKNPDNYCRQRNRKKRKNRQAGRS
jgi:hypothetical protein